MSCQEMEVSVIQNQRGQKPGRNILTESEMLDLASSQRESRLYSRSADSGEKVSAIVGTLANELSELPEKISLNDTALVLTVAKQYVNACAAVGSIPSKIGCCRAFGCSRQAVDNFMLRNPEHPTTDLLQILFDAFAEALNNAALTGSCHPIVGIFISKAVYQWKESVVLETPVSKPLGDDPSFDDLRNRIESNVVFDGDEYILHLQKGNNCK